MRVHRFPAFVVPEHWTWPSFGSLPPGVEGVEEPLPLDDAGVAEGRFGVLVGVAGAPLVGLPLGGLPFGVDGLCFPGFLGGVISCIDGVNDSSLSGVSGRCGLPELDLGFGLEGVSTGRTSISWLCVKGTEGADEGLAGAGEISGRRAICMVTDCF
jgi:hypothetical protein